ncbi:hypothetical protein HEQ75_27610 [Roseomonas sp. BU-1]|uniref:Type I-E CRISPR-associated protein Cse2/CasB n=2 Tax=Falsiroseomonas selenitidurans TaxID=2716335 RepID=A0ABX1EGK7_9PROT|nr:hypothetical protein [Falsiroseomonas selenitidurans]
MIPGLRAEAVALLAAAEFAKNQHICFRRSAPRLLTVLATMAKANAAQFTYEERVSEVARQAGVGSRTSTGGATEFRTVTVGPLDGAEFLSDGYSPERDARALLTEMDLWLPGSPLTDDALLDLVASFEAHNPAKAVELWSWVSGLPGALRRAWAKVDAAQAFLSPENTGRLTRWGKQIGDREASAQRGADSIVFRYREDGASEFTSVPLGPK